MANTLFTFFFDMLSCVCVSFFHRRLFYHFSKYLFKLVLLYPTCFCWPAAGHCVWFSHAVSFTMTIFFFQTTDQNMRFVYFYCYFIFISKRKNGLYKCVCNCVYKHDSISITTGEIHKNSDCNWDSVKSNRYLRSI